MTPKEFWEDDPQLFMSYRISYINRKKREVEELDYKCWLQGLYNHKGNNLLFAKLMQFIHNIIAKKPNNDDIEGYPLKPYSELKKEQENKNEIEIENSKRQNETLICQASLKHIYVERIKRQNKGSDANE